MCPDIKIKSSPGNATNCNDDTACDGKSSIPNVGHTACGKLTISIFLFTLSCIFCVRYNKYGKVHRFQYVMLVSTRKEGPVYCVQMTGSKHHLVMPQNVIVLVM